VLDWTAYYTLAGRYLKYQIQAAVYNVLNEEYQLIRDMPLPGREWRIGLSVSY
jgi:outer membrane receptor protein involved in Fe transport